MRTFTTLPYISSKLLCTKGHTVCMHPCWWPFDMTLPSSSWRVGPAPWMPSSRGSRARTRPPLTRGLGARTRAWPGRSGMGPWSAWRNFLHFEFLGFLSIFYVLQLCFVKLKQTTLLPPFTVGNMFQTPLVQLPIIFSESVILITPVSKKPCRSNNNLRFPNFTRTISDFERLRMAFELFWRFPKNIRIQILKHRVSNEKRLKLSVTTASRI